MGAAKVLLIESVRANGSSFAEAIAKRYDLFVAYSGKEGLAVAQGAEPDVIVLDAVSMRTSGDRISRKLQKYLPETPVVHIRPDEVTGKPNKSVADVVLFYPFTFRKLHNRIKHFLDQDIRADDIVQVGGIALNVPKRLLVVGEQEKRLTPKLAGLAEVFLRAPNTIIARKTLIKQVWKTEYMGDTRTLDVHIRWLREAVEENPSRPRIITTVRGVGYRMVPPA